MPREPSEPFGRFRLELPALRSHSANFWPTRHIGSRGVSPIAPHTQAPPFPTSRACHPTTTMHVITFGRHNHNYHFVRCPPTSSTSRARTFMFLPSFNIAAPRFLLSHAMAARTQLEPAQQPMHLCDRRPHGAITAVRKILTRGKCGTTCYKARGRPSNASSDPVPEKHAPTAALEGRKQVACQLAKR